MLRVVDLLGSYLERRTDDANEYQRNTYDQNIQQQSKTGGLGSVRAANSDHHCCRELWDLVPEEEGDETNKSSINILNVYSHLHPEITDPQQLADTAEEWAHNVLAYHKRHKAEN